MSRRLSAHNKTESSWKSLFNIESLFPYKFCLKKYAVGYVSETIIHFAKDLLSQFTSYLLEPLLTSSFSTNFTISSESTKTLPDSLMNLNSHKSFAFRNLQRYSVLTGENCQKNIFLKLKWR